MARKLEFDKDEALEKAMLLFWEHGYESTSTRALIEVMGISNSSMYETFGDKRSIFLAALKRYCQLELNMVRELIRQSSDVKQFIQKLFNNSENIVFNQRYKHGSMAFNAVAEFGIRDLDVSDVLFSHHMALVEIIAKVLSVAQQAGEISSSLVPMRIAHVIIASLHGLMSLKSVKPDFADSDTFCQVILKMLEC